jgi:hypothetical protein
MDNQLPDLPTIPMPSVKSPHKRRIRWFVMLMSIGLLLVLILGVSIFSKIFGPSRLQASRATPITKIATATLSNQPSASATQPFWPLERLALLPHPFRSQRSRQRPPCPV